MNPQPFRGVQVPINDIRIAELVEPFDEVFEDLIEAGDLVGVGLG
jgi:hypothetical protein